MKERALIIGGGSWAIYMAEALIQSGTPVLITGLKMPDALLSPFSSSPDAADLLEIMSGIQIRSLTGTSGRFRVEFGIDGRRIRRQVRHIILAEDTVKQVNGSFYGLTEGPFVISISGLKAMLNSQTEKHRLPESIKRVAFLTGLFHESLPVTSEAVMESALQLQRNFNIQSYLFTGNLKVSGVGLEALYRKTKEAGVVFFKSTDTPPTIAQAEDGSVILTFMDEILRQVCILQPDLTVLDETVLPSMALKAVAEILDLKMGEDGFIPTDNVHRLPTSTDRKGIWVIGPARGASPPWVNHADIAHTAISISSPDATEAALEGKAFIETGRCIRCLTCFRVCPHRAVELSPRPVIAAAACEGCGICVAECPCCAIMLPGSPALAESLTNVAAKIEPGDAGRPTGFVPSVTVFCCARSAVPARQMAQAMGNPLPENHTFVEVPCAGAVSQHHLLDAFHRGADGVLVMGCHNDNCHSGRGTLLARTRVAHCGTVMPALGLPSNRLAFRTLAANMGAEFSQAIREFIADLKPVRPNPGKIKSCDS